MLFLIECIDNNPNVSCPDAVSCSGTEGIQCEFESGCGCGYQFLSSSSKDVWHLVEEGNATDLTFSGKSKVKY